MEPRRRPKNPAANIKSLSPRVKMGLRLWLGGSMTKKQAAEAVGIAPQYLSQLTASFPAQAFIQKHEEAIDEKSLDVNRLLAKLSREAVETTASIMRKGDKEENRLRAAIDLADRGSETSKIQKHQVETLSLRAEDAKAIAAAMVQAATLREQFSEATQGSFDRTKFIGAIEAPKESNDGSGSK